MGNCCGSRSVDAEEKLDYSAGNVTTISDQRSWDKKLEEASELGKVVVAKFSATWCGPCRTAAPIFAEFSVNYPTVIFSTVDVDELPDLVSSFDICATPTFVFMKDRKEVDKLVGGTRADLEKKLEPFCQQK